VNGQALQGSRTLVPGDRIRMGLTVLELRSEAQVAARGSAVLPQPVRDQEDGALRPQIWTRTVGRGRVVVALPGHYTWTFDDPIFRLLAFRGICWAAGQPEDRLNELVTIGARISDAP